MAGRQIIKPQAGPQTQFLSTAADIAIYGGGAGGGKTWALLLEAMRHRAVKGFTACIFRRNLVQATAPGGIWEQSYHVYGPAGGRPKQNPLGWTFPSSAVIRFGHLESESTVLDWQGTELALICFDELTHFSQAQFFYMLSRNRSMCGVRPYVRATCNPDADSWVARFISWWIDPNTGLPIPERAGKVRWFVRFGDALFWADDPDELRAKYPNIPPKSVTFIPARLADNQALMERNPDYLANLMALPTVERERLLAGNWKIRPAAGLYFRREWCPFVDTAPAGLKFVRYWDLAATPKTESNDPDWTVGTKLGRSEGGIYFICHAVRLQAAPAERDAALKHTAQADGKSVRIGLPQDPGQAGKSQAIYLVGQLDGYQVQAAIESGDKVTRFGPVSSQAKVGNVVIVKGDWNEDFLSSLEGFPDATHDDDADSLAGAHRMFQETNDGLIDYYRRLVEAEKAAAEKALAAAKPEGRA